MGWSHPDFAAYGATLEVKATPQALKCTSLNAN
jgi:hypothetical protein